MRFKNKIFALMVPFIMFSVPFVHAEGETNIVSFSTEIEKGVEYDLLQVVLFTQAENTELKSATKQVNLKMNKALDIIRSVETIEIKENSRTTGVRYSSKGKQDGWIARGTLVLEGQDHDTLSKVLTDLDGVLAVQSVNPSVSSSTLKNVENEMIREVLSQFQNKAEIIQSSLNAKGYKIVGLNITTPVSSQNARAYGVRMLNKKSYFSDEAVDIDIGESKATLNATVDARIEMIME